MRFGLDYGGYLTPAQHQAVHSTFACRYLRELGVVEARDLHAAGIDVVLIYERNASRALGGHGQGVADAQEARVQADRLGAPATTAVYFAVDFDETPAQAPTVADYFRGIRTVLPPGRIGAYGGYWTVMRLFDLGLITFGWQTYAWSGGHFEQRCRLYQYLNNQRLGGINVDYNHAFAADFGQWLATARPQRLWASVELRLPIQFDEIAGAWRAGPATFQPQPFNAPPLGP